MSNKEISTFVRCYDIRIQHPMTLYTHLESTQKWYWLSHASLVFTEHICVEMPLLIKPSLTYLVSLETRRVQLCSATVFRLAIPFTEPNIGNYRASASSSSKVQSRINLYERPYAVLQPQILACALMMRTDGGLYSCLKHGYGTVAMI